MRNLSSITKINLLQDVMYFFSIMIEEKQKCSAVLGALIVKREAYSSLSEYDIDKINDIQYI